MNTPDNAGSQGREPVLLMALRAGRVEHTPEAEPVLVALEAERVVLVLDDGERLEFDERELLAALEEQRITLREAA